MNFTKFCSIFFTLVCIGHIESSYQCGIRKHAFIQLVSHGWKVEEGQWPWHVAMFHRTQNGTTYACGGTLIDQKHVLTAAHCVVNKRTKNPLPVGNLLLHFGQNQLSKVGKHVQVRDVARIHVHPEFSTHRNDIAVLELRIPVEFTDFVIPICLDMRVGRDLRNLEGQRGWITGWGTTQNGTVSNELQSASLPVVSYLQCFKDDQTLFGSVLNENVFCAGDRNGTSPGTGDSGGGMFFSDGDRWVLRGVISFAKVDETRFQVDTSKYSVYVNVQRFLTWIREVTKDKTTNSSAGDTIQRISERECERFRNLTRERSNGICSNARYPHTVSIVYSDGQDKCTGVLVNENHVLTACHCYESAISHKLYPSMVRVSDYGTVNILSITCHPAYNIRKGLHDIAVLKLGSPVQLSYNIVPACLASNWTENLYDTLLTTGFRRSRQAGVQQFFESDANQVITADECTRNISVHEFIILPVHLCVVNNDRLPASSQGSAGAPLQSVNTRSCVFTVVGVLSTFRNSIVEGDRTPDDTLLDVFSRVAYYLDWIEAIVWGERAVPPATMRTSAQSTTENIPDLKNDFVFPTD